MAKKIAVTKEQLETHIANMVEYKNVVLPEYIKQCKGQLKVIVKGGATIQTEPPNPPKNPPFP